VKVYCAAPIRGNTESKKYTDLIPDIVSSAGDIPLTELTLLSSPKRGDQEIFRRDILWLEESDCVIADVSSASTGTGFEVSYALYNLRIPLLAIYSEERSSSVSAMIKGCNSPLIFIAQYKNADEMKIIIEDFLDKTRLDIERERIL
jgi:2'-deoxynucleoside 5'-phosphate N-hydrolase